MFRKFTFLLALLFLNFVNAQSVRNIGINQYKYIVVDEIIGKHSGELRRFFVKNLEKGGYNVVNLKKPLKTHDDFPTDLQEDPSLAVYLVAEEITRGCYDIITSLLDSDQSLLLQRTGSSCGLLSTAIKKSISGLTSYNYRYDPNERTKNSLVSNSNLNSSLNFNSEASIRKYFDENGADGYEGIWEYNSDDNSQYKLAIIKEDFRYKAYILEGSGLWKPGDLKATIETAATDQVFTIRWTMGNKRDVIKRAGVGTNFALMEFDLSGKTQLYKVYPKMMSSSSKPKLKSGEWAGNGSGLIISKSGYIVTNNHVIEDASEIEIELIKDGEVQKYNAEIVQTDKVNDLAIIKIFDMSFDGIDNLPYNFKTRSSDVGTKIYAYGYPMALTLMGKEIKVTDGIISSKTGVNGDITTYQITAPIQGGNSGGPLFDDKGNMLGINSSGLRKDIADNVGYSIKSSYVLNLIDVLPKSIELPSSSKLSNLPLTEQIKEISKCVVLVKVK